jgi:hypothetical protein
MLGESFFVEKGKVTSQKEIGPNSTLFNFSSKGTMNGNIEVTITGVIKKGSFVMCYIGDNCYLRIVFFCAASTS